MKSFLLSFGRVSVFLKWFFKIFCSTKTTEMFWNIACVCSIHTFPVCFIHFASGWFSTHLLTCHSCQFTFGSYFYPCATFIRPYASSLPVSIMTHANTQLLQQLQQIIIKLLLPAQQPRIGNVNLDSSYILDFLWWKSFWSSFLLASNNNPLSHGVCWVSD